jgi:DNA-binding MarR family transcriptional regulator
LTYFISFDIFSNMIISNNNISYENAWKQLRTISEPAMLIVALIHLGELLFTLGEKRVFKPVGIGVHEFQALFNITHQEKPTPTLLAQYSLMPPAKITRVLDKLEQKGAIIRNPIKGDRRSYSLSITEKGTELYKQAEEQFKQAGERIKKEMGPENITLFSRFIIGFIEHLGG